MAGVLRPAAGVHHGQVTATGLQQPDRQHVGAQRPARVPEQLADQFRSALGHGESAHRGGEAGELLRRASFAVAGGP